jgi:hypothetical protein
MLGLILRSQRFLALHQLLCSSAAAWSCQCWLAAASEHATPAQRAYQVEKASTWAVSVLYKAFSGQCGVCTFLLLCRRTAAGADAVLLPGGVGPLAISCIMWTFTNQLHHAKVPDWSAAQLQIEGCGGAGSAACCATLNRPD